MTFAIVVTKFAIINKETEIIIIGPYVSDFGEFTKKGFYDPDPIISKYPKTVWLKFKNLFYDYNFCKSVLTGMKQITQLKFYLSPETILQYQR